MCTVFIPLYGKSCVVSCTVYFGFIEIGGLWGQICTCAIQQCHLSYKYTYMNSHMYCMSLYQHNAQTRWYTMSASNKWKLCVSNKWRILDSGGRCMLRTNITVHTSSDTVMFMCICCEHSLSSWCRDNDQNCILNVDHSACIGWCSCTTILHVHQCNLYSTISYEHRC